MTSPKGRRDDETYRAAALMTGAAKVGRHRPRPGRAGRCRPKRHVFVPFTPTDDLGAGAQKCECGEFLIDRTLGGGRVVEVSEEFRG